MRGVAGAPVSFGVFELTADVPPSAPDDVLGALRDAGYDGVDLGPVGWLGRGDALRDRLRRHGLSLSGGWLDLPFSDDAAFMAALPSLEETLAVFRDAAEVDPARPPLPTLADSGSDDRRANFGGRTPGIGLDEPGWDRFAANVSTAATRVRAWGLEPTFHHHAGTYVETPEEIDSLLARTDVGLTIDTGHLLVCGGDPMDALARWGDRTNHVHVKDARLDVVHRIAREHAGARAIWEWGAFVALGEGDVDLDAFMTELVATGYGGWLVVEQDVLPSPDDPQGRAAEDQRANRDVLRTWVP